MENQKVCDVLNSLEVVHEEGGDHAASLVEASAENLKKLESVGIDRKTALKYGDTNETEFCILALGFSENYADGIEKGKLVNKEDQFTNLLNEMGDSLYNGKIMRAGSKRNALIGMFKKELFRDA